MSRHVDAYVRGEDNGSVVLDGRESFPDRPSRQRIHSRGTLDIISIHLLASGTKVAHFINKHNCSAVAFSMNFLNHARENG